jgi:ATP-dependent RNA helicase RhlE
MTSFQDLGLSAPLLRALSDEGYTTPTPIQAQAIPHVLAGRDLLGIAQTGTGKTAAFALPILQRLAENPHRPAPRTVRALILSPTRELALQIADSFRTYGRHLGFSVATVFGGVPHGAQIRALARGVDILVATPGRLIDHMQSRNADLSRTEILVLDEADQMLDLGFVLPIRRIVAPLPKRRLSLFFSATMPQAIGQLASELLTDPARVQVAPVAATADRVDQRVIWVDGSAKRATLVDLLKGDAKGRTLVFVRTKHGADAVVKHLENAGLGADAIHGNRSQGQRVRALEAFKSGRAPVLVATDIAARGIDVDGVTHVINLDLPNVPESYVHRIGRTARAGAAGQAISIVATEERGLLRDIEKLIRKAIPAEDRRSVRTETPHLTPRPLPRHGKPQRPHANGNAPRPQQGDKAKSGGFRTAQGKPHKGGHGRPGQNQRRTRVA